MSVDRVAKNTENVQNIETRLEAIEDQAKSNKALTVTHLAVGIIVSLLTSAAMFFAGLQYVVDHAVIQVKFQTAEIVKRLDTLVAESKKEEKRNDNQDTRLERHEVQLQNLMGKK